MTPPHHVLARAAEKACEAQLHVESVAERRDEGRWGGDELALRTSLALVSQLEALRLTIVGVMAPITAPIFTLGVKEKTPPRWVRLELFGHQVRYGNLLEVEVGGKTFLRLVEPSIACGDEVIRDALVKDFHTNAVYAIADVGEEQVMDALRRQAGLHCWWDGSWHRQPNRCNPEQSMHYYGVGDRCDCGAEPNTFVIANGADEGVPF